MQHGGHITKDLLGPRGVPVGGGGGVSLPESITDDFSADSGLWLDGDLNPAAMTVSGGRGIWTPTDGAELVPNGDMETDAGWTNTGTPTTNALSEEQKHGGTYSRKVVTDAAFEGASTVKWTTVTGNWYRFKSWSWAASDNVYHFVRQGGGAGINLSVAVPGASAWGQVFRIYRELAGGNGAYVYGQYDAVGTFYLDDWSLIPLTDASLYRVQRICCPCTLSAKIRRTTGTVAGVAFYKDSQNYIMAYVDYGNNLRLVKRVAGTVTQVGTSAITYANDAAVLITPNADFNSFTASYGGVAVISDVAITDFAADVTSDKFNTAWYVGMFNTHNAGDIDTDSFDDFEATSLNFP